MADPLRDLRIFVAARRVSDSSPWRVLQRHVQYLGGIDDSRAQAWRRSIEVLDEREDAPRTVALFPDDRIDELSSDASVVRLRLSQRRLCQPRVRGSCWPARKLWQRLELDRLWSQRLSRSRKGTRWEQVLLVLVAYRLKSRIRQVGLAREGLQRYIEPTRVDLEADITGCLP